MLRQKRVDRWFKIQDAHGDGGVDWWYLEGMIDAETGTAEFTDWLPEDDKLKKAYQMGYQDIKGEQLAE